MEGGISVVIRTYVQRGQFPSIRLQGPIQLQQQFTFITTST